MLTWALCFLVLALITAGLGLWGLTETAAQFAKVFFALFLALFLFSLVFGQRLAMR